jgi:hypothetical protein
MRKINFEDNILYIDNKELIFSDEICQVKIDNDKIYVLLEIPPKDKLSYDDFHNIFCYSIDGEKEWQIGVRSKGDEAVYTMIDFDDKFLYANDFMGRKFSVDKKTGETKGMIITK